MLLDKESMFSEAQVPTLTNAAETDSENVLDWKSHGNDIDHVLRFFVLNTQTAASAGAATLTITFKTSADGVTYTTLKTYTAIALATLAAGTFLLNNEALPSGLLRYNKLTYTVGGADFTTGPKLTAGLIRNDGYVAR